jgi:hypothetical protein
VKVELDIGSEVWYVGYGSNLCEQRFLCYIKGGTPRFGQKCHGGCADSTPPRGNRSIVIPYPLYFGLPEGKNGTENWGPGGVAFISPRENTRAETLGRMWLITRDQYAEVREQEGSWYSKEIELGKNDGIPVYTITHAVELANILPPSQAYMKTIALGLKETCGWNNEAVADYLAGRMGPKDAPSKDKKSRILACLE